LRRYQELGRLIQTPAFSGYFQRSDEGDEFVGDHTERDLSDIHLVARNQLEQEVKWAVKVI
jgi:hypothetical protein